MDQFELDGVYAEVDRLAALSRSKRPLYGDRFLSKRTPGTEHLGAPPDAELSHDDILGAVAELAAQHHVSTARIRGMCTMATVQAGLGRSVQEEAAVLNEVMLSLQAGDDAVSGEQILALSGRAGGDTFGLAAAEDPREAVRDEAMVFGLTVTAAERDRLVKSGQAMPGGDFPVHDARHLAAAKSEYRKRHLAGHSAAEVRAHINKNAKRLGLPGLDDDDHDDDHDGDVAATMALTQETTAALALTAGQDSAAAVVARHPELSHLFRAGKTSSRRHPAKAGREVTTRTRAHSSDTGDEDTRDTDQPAKGGQPHRRAAREIMKDNPDLFGDREAATGNFSSPPKSPRQREREEQRAQAGRPGGRSIEDLSRGSARTRGGR